RRERGTDTQADPRGRAGLADLPRWMPRRRDAGTGWCTSRSGDNTIACDRRRNRACRAWTHIARSRGALDRASRRVRSAFSAQYRNDLYPRLLPRNTRSANLERAFDQLEWVVGQIRASRRSIDAA